MKLAIGTTWYRNEYGDVTTHAAEADGWSDAALEVDLREGAGALWKPFNDEGEEAVTTDRIAHYASREAALAGGCYSIECPLGTPATTTVYTELEGAQRAATALDGGFGPELHLVRHDALPEWATGVA